ncbi:MAG: formate dehydrogenase accessory sulfurtransferase FdhD, partial [Bacillota bacterium]|nr:formate dehydrogenase accessory sulfurtransferase FdhD [Bacillota bacterium]
MPNQETHTARPVLQIDDHGTVERDDLIIVEEPLEIRVNGAPYAVVMRTPGHEMELVAGFCLTEGLVDSFSQILSMGFCAEARDQMKNVVNAICSPGPAGSPSGSSEAPEVPAGPRNLASRSSCGICGVRMIED